MRYSLNLFAAVIRFYQAHTYFAILMKVLFLLLLFLATTTAATAQTNCDRPVVKLLRNKQEIPSTGSALFAAITLRVTPATGCPEQRYQFRNAEITLVRGGRPLLPTLLVSQPQADLSDFVKAYQSGDHVLVFIAYQNLAVVAPDGSLQPYVRAKPKKTNAGKIDLETDDSKGIGFKWQLVKP